MERDVHGTAFAIHGVPGMLHASENLMACDVFGTLVPQLEVGAAERGAQNPHQCLAFCRHGYGTLLYGDPLIAMENRCAHGYSTRHDNHPLTAPSVRPETSQRWTIMARTRGGRAMRVAAAISAPQLVEPSPMKLNEAAISVFVSELDSTSAKRK